MKMREKVKEIKNALKPAEVLAGLAEECGELVQAALKLRRVYDGTNPTPVSEEDAIDKLYEEVADVRLYITILSMNEDAIKEIMERKLDRWLYRLEHRRAE